MPCRSLAGVALLVGLLAHNGFAPRLHAAEELSPFGRLLNAGLPEARLPGILEFIGTRGTRADLALVLQKCTEKDGLPVAVRPAALAALEKAAVERNLAPEGDLDRVATLLGEAHPANVRMAAMRLAGRWKVASLAAPLSKIAVAESTTAELRSAAIAGLTGIGGAASRSVIESLTQSERPLALRFEAAAALAEFDVAAAARTAARVLADGDGDSDPAPVIAAFLERPGASDELAAALAKVELSKDLAKLGLRYVYSVGRNDPALTALLSGVAGITTEPIKLSPEEMVAFTKEVAEKGDPVRGEAVFRRADLSCFKCHALRGAGGKVGPELSTVGASSPPDYVARAVLDPDKDIKEVYRTATVVTDEGKAYHGIVVDDTEEKLVLREATGTLRTFPVDTLDDREEGGSLMPKGLAGFMTRGELVDLVRFLSELGRPGPYAPSTAPTLQRWQYLKTPPAVVADDIPNDEAFSAAVHEAQLPWLAFYARVLGDLPLNELAPLVKGDTLLLRTELEVSSAGEVTIAFDAPAGLHVWVNGESFDLDANGRLNVDLDEGRHQVDVRIDRKERTSNVLAAKLAQSPTSEAVVRPIGGT